MSGRCNIALGPHPAGLRCSAIRSRSNISDGVLRAGTVQARRQAGLTRVHTTGLRVGARPGCEGTYEEQFCVERKYGYYSVVAAGHMSPALYALGGATRTFACDTSYTQRASQSYVGYCSSGYLPAEWFADGSAGEASVTLALLSESAGRRCWSGRRRAACSRPRASPPPCRWARASARRRRGPCAYICLAAECVVC